MSVCVHFNSSPGVQWELCYFNSLPGEPWELFHFNSLPAAQWELCFHWVLWAWSDICVHSRPWNSEQKLSWDLSPAGRQTFPETFLLQGDMTFPTFTFRKAIVIRFREEFIFFILALFCSVFEKQSHRRILCWQHLKMYCLFQLVFYSSSFLFWETFLSAQQTPSICLSRNILWLVLWEHSPHENSVQDSSYTCVCLPTPGATFPTVTECCGHNGGGYLCVMWPDILNTVASFLLSSILSCSSYQSLLF